MITRLTNKLVDAEKVPFRLHQSLY